MDKEAMASQGWEEVEHTADWSIRVWGEDLRSLFENAARGMVSLIEGKAAPEQSTTEHTFELEAPDLEVLLVDWLTELLTLIEDEGIIFSHIRVAQVDDLKLVAQASGQPGGAFSKHIKAVTFHNLAVRRTSTGYETVIVFDV
ncbi:MAG: archease [Anaerolineae bacterium]|nr:archease [Anaerolineae bacterium]